MSKVIGDSDYNGFPSNTPMNKMPISRHPVPLIDTPMHVCGTDDVVGGGGGNPNGNSLKRELANQQRELERVIYRLDPYLNTVTSLLEP